MDEYKLKEEIFKELREQKDREGISTISGIYTFNPKTLKAPTVSKRNIKPSKQVVGPIFFNTKFTKTPVVTFGQVQQDSTQLCIVQPFVNSWKFQAGVVEGFFLGLYPIAVDTTAEKHLISWIAQGNTSAYMDLGVSQAWETNYNDMQAPSRIGRI